MQSFFLLASAAASAFSAIVFLALAVFVAVAAAAVAVAAVTIGFVREYSLVTYTAIKIEEKSSISCGSGTKINICRKKYVRCQFFLLVHSWFKQNLIVLGDVKRIYIFTAWYKIIA